jgi:hypothetical protein
MRRRLHARPRRAEEGRGGQRRGIFESTSPPRRLTILPYRGTYRPGELLRGFPCCVLQCWYRAHHTVPLDLDSSWPLLNKWRATQRPKKPDKMRRSLGMAEAFHLLLRSLPSFLIGNSRSQSTSCDCAISMLNHARDIGNSKEALTLCVSISFLPKA